MNYYYKERNNPKPTLSPPITVGLRQQTRHEERDQSTTALLGHSRASRMGMHLPLVLFQRIVTFLAFLSMDLSAPLRNFYLENQI